MSGIRWDAQFTVPNVSSGSNPFIGAFYAGVYGLNISSNSGTDKSGKSDSSSKDTLIMPTFRVNEIRQKTSAMGTISRPNRRGGAIPNGWKTVITDPDAIQGILDGSIGTPGAEALAVKAEIDATNGL
jgi:hypothetical protein